MFFIFVFIVCLLFLVGLLLLLIGNKVYMSIKRENRKFDMEEEIQKEILKKAIKQNQNNNQKEKEND